MEYLEFERILSAKRMQRYKDAANGDTRKAMALYRYNLRLSQEMFTIVSCFEVALRNAIDSLLVPTLGENWLKDAVQDNGIFSNGRMNETRKIIEKAYNRLTVPEKRSLLKKILHPHHNGSGLSQAPELLTLPRQPLAFPAKLRWNLQHLHRLHTLEYNKLCLPSLP